MRVIIKQEPIVLERDQCEVLTLVLKKKWFDMIASGEKTEEYRVSKTSVRRSNDGTDVPG